MAILTALCLISPLAAGYSFEPVEEAELWYMEWWNNSHENEVDPNDWDGELDYALDDGVCELVDSLTHTYNYPGTEADPVVIDVLPGYLVFHVNCELMLRWTDDAPEGCTSMEVSADLVLYRKVGGYYVAKCDDHHGYEFTDEGFKFDEFGLHVLEEMLYQPNTLLWIHFQVNGEWWEGATRHNLASASEDIYYRIQ